MKQLKDFFAGKKVSSVIDAGTGSGDFIAVLKDIFPGATITGIDPDSTSMQEAAKIFPDVTFKKMSADDLKFENDSFDVASISMALHHLPDIQKALKELQRVVKPGGWIIVNELFSDNLNPAQEVHKMFHHFRGRIDRLTGVSHNDSFKKEVIREMVKVSGIDIVFDFENIIETNLIAKEGELEIRIKKLEDHLEKIKDRPEYNELKPQIEEFRKKALKYGFQNATRIVIVGKPA